MSNAHKIHLNDDQMQYIADAIKCYETQGGAKIKPEADSLAEINLENLESMFRETIGDKTDSLHGFCL